MFHNNCLGRCIGAVIAGSECVRLEREYQQRKSFSNGHAGDMFDSELPGRLSAEASIKSTMQLFVKFSAAIILDSWNETNRYFRVPSHAEQIDKLFVARKPVQY